MKLSKDKEIGFTCFTLAPHRTSHKLYFIHAVLHYVQGCSKTSGQMVNYQMAVP